MKPHYLQQAVFYPEKQPYGPAPLLMCHGAGGNHQHFLGIARLLKDKVNCVPVDLPGHGRHKGPPCPSVDLYAQALAEAVEEAGLEKVFLMGHSMGGGVALAYTLLYPEKVRGLVLMGTGAKLGVNPLLLESLTQNMDLFLNTGVPTSFGPTAPTHLVESARKALALAGRELLLNDFLACKAFDLRDRVPEIQCPALILCGDKDLLTPPKYSQWLGETLTHSRLEILPEIGHMLMLEAPSAVAELVSGFLSEFSF